MIKGRSKSKGYCEIFNLYKIIPSIFLISGDSVIISLFTSKKPTAVISKTDTHLVSMSPFWLLPFCTMMPD